MDITNLVFGILGTTGTAEAVVKILGNRFPEAELKKLNDVLDTTHKLFQDIADNSLPLPDDAKGEAVAKLAE